jgi:hypothetical protein
VLICGCSARSTRLTRLWRISRNRHNLRLRSRIRFRVDRLVLILTRCVISVWIFYYDRTLTCYFIKDELRKELEDLEQDKLNEMLQGAEPAPIHLPPGATRTIAGRFMVTIFIITRSADLCSRATSRTGRGRNAEEVTGRTCDVTPLFRLRSPHILV